MQANEDNNAIKKNTYCLEMRESFKGIKVEANAKIADQIVQRLTKTRHLRHAQTFLSHENRDAFDHYPKSPGTINPEISTIPKLPMKLHWTIKPCNIPSNNWYICEKTIEQNEAIPKMKKSGDNDPSIQVLEKGKDCIVTLCYNYITFLL